MGVSVPERMRNRCCLRGMPSASMTAWRRAPRVASSATSTVKAFPSTLLMLVSVVVSNVLTLGWNGRMVWMGWGGMGWNGMG